MKFEMEIKILNWNIGKMASRKIQDGVQFEICLEKSMQRKILLQKCELFVIVDFWFV
jgi:hypothetical protein